ncbi:sulfur acquisition oxidoreductase, SfnB family [Gordonia paraffinivorans]|uniref:Sulfur acquisition oxidoreductase, SfnB family n=1 Tax=Gordonia paraffinivorans TaxID=175628 RepID=A0ABD7V7V8_9ACTN|nr:acyl-CoA dehydrogenase family protein [Gordonia paraffinivorans]VFA90299.1 sulfur acquisition oxidoreductase, SfnB family [Gordonia paraffinivorans]
MTNIAPTLAPSHLSDPVADEDDLLARFAPVFERIAAGNTERERHRKFPFEEVDELNRAGFGRIRIPVELGGFGASLEQTFVLLARLGAADANVAHVWRNHLAFVEDRLNAAPSEGNARWIARFLDGEFVGGGWTEANNGTFANIATTVRRVGDAYRVTGAKYYATGSLYADWLDVIGKDDDGSLYTALVRRDDPGVELVDDWTGFGQQTTASGSATYTDVPADPDDVFPASERFVYQGHFYQTAILAVLTGITQAALRDGITALRERGRNYPQGLDPVPVRDAQVLQVIGEVSAQVFAAESALRTVARSLDAVAAAQAAGDLTARGRAVTDAQVATDHAQLVIIEAALTATTTVFDALGASGVSTDRLLDRHWRNARTLASHNPRVYKARIIGDWLVNGTDPVPDLGLFGRGGQGN